MTENFEYFTVKFIEFQQNNENLQQALKTDENKILSANIFLNEILNFDLIKTFCDLLEFNKKIWTKVLYAHFDKIEFESLNKFFAENFKKLNNSKINELKKQINNLDKENKILKNELEKILFTKKGLRETEKIKLIINTSIAKNKEIIINKTKITNELNHNDQSIISNNSKKSSLRKKNHSKSFFISNKRRVNKNNVKEINVKDSSDKNISFLNESSAKDLLDKNSFNKLVINPNYDTNNKNNDNYMNYNSNYSYSNLISDPFNKYLINYNNDVDIQTNNNPNNRLIHTTSYENNYKPVINNANSETNNMLSNILDKYKNENANTNTFNAGGYNPNINAERTFVKLESRYINPYAPTCTDSSKNIYSFNSNNLINKADDLIFACNQNDFNNNNKYFAGSSYSVNANNYNTITNIPNYSSANFNSNNNNKKELITDKETNKSIVYNTINNDYINKNNQDNYPQSVTFNLINDNQFNFTNENNAKKNIKNISNNETFCDNKQRIEKNLNTKRSIKLTENNEPTSNFNDQTSKDISVLSSNIFIDNQDKNTKLNLKENNNYRIKKTKSFSKLKTANKVIVKDNNCEKLISNYFLSFYFSK